jgi:hypothetical protein
VTWLYNASIKLMSRRLAAADRWTRELSQAKSRLWHCSGDSSQTLKIQIPASCLHNNSAYGYKRISLLRRYGKTLDLRKNIGGSGNQRKFVMQDACHSRPGCCVTIAISYPRSRRERPKKTPYRGGFCRARRASGTACPLYCFDNGILDHPRRRAGVMLLRLLRFQLQDASLHCVLDEA